VSAHQYVIMNLDPAAVFITVFILASGLTVLLYKLNGTLGNIVNNAPGINYKATPFYISLMFLLVFVNTVMFATDNKFQNSWALWPFVGLQSGYAINWIIYLYLEYRDTFVWSTVTNLVINENLFIQIYASVVLCIACIAENTGVQYIALQLVVLLHTAIYDFAFYITCLE